MQWDFPLRAPVLSMMAGRRRNETVCESLFCTIAVITPVVVAIVVYRKDVRELLKILFFIFLVLGACLTFRHTFFRLIYRVRTFLRRRRPQVYEGECTLDVTSFSSCSSSVLQRVNEVSLFPAYAQEVGYALITSKLASRSQPEATSKYAVNPRCSRGLTVYKEVMCITYDGRSLSDPTTSNFLVYS